jgi:hypothetical protein
VIDARRRAMRALALLLAAALAAGVCACSPPPALTRVELEAKKVPGKHPKLSEKQKQNCRSCHREAPAIRK